jgi:uncharacterized protein
LIRYLDASAVVPLYVNEAASTALRRWFAGTGSTGAALSRWTLTEFVSALGIRVRTKTVTAPAAQRAIAAFQSLANRSLIMLPIAPPDFERADDLLLDFPLGLRAGDALHVAIALNAGAGSLVTLDRTMVLAAERLGLACEIPA